jgi:KDO2-lipid IV(A) lauroyltransferase
VKHKFIQYPIYLVIRVAVCFLQALSIEACADIAKLAAWLAYDVFRIRRELLDENIQHALPHLAPREQQQLARRTCEHLVLMCCELVHAPRKIHESNWRKHVVIKRKREIVTQLLDPRPTCLVTGHYGNFEFGGYMTGILGFVTHTVARTIDNPYLDEFMLKFREAKRQYILPKVGSAPQADAVLKTGGTLVLLGDQNAGNRGCKVDFLHRPTHCHKALALFTLVSGAPMMVNYCRRRGKPMQFEIGLVGIADPAIGGPQLADARRLSQWYMDCLAQLILESPDQYWWLHRLWREIKPSKKEQATEVVSGSQREAERHAA